MALSKTQVCERIADMHLDELDLVITRDGDGFAVAENRSGAYGCVSDIGSSYEVPDSADEHGRRGFTAGPWTGYQYHASYTAPHRANYEAELDDLAAGDISRVVVGATAICENDTWVLGVRSEN